MAGASYPTEFEGRKIISSPGKSFVSVLSDEYKGENANRVLAWPHALRDGEWKLVLEKPAKPELYNISRDRNEQKNLVSEFPERLRAMKDMHSQFFSSEK